MRLEEQVLKRGRRGFLSATRGPPGLGVSLSRVEKRVDGSSSAPRGALPWQRPGQVTGDVQCPVRWQGASGEAVTVVDSLCGGRVHLERQ